MIEVFGIVSGLIIGLLFGFVLQKGRFCMNSAFRDPLVFKDFTLLKAVVLALVVQLIGFHVLSSLGIITLAPKTFYLFGAILGGFIFGIGMVIAGGCASGTAYRVGEGMVASMIALVGFVSAAYFAKDGFLSSITKSIQQQDLGKITLSSVTGISVWVFVILFSIIGIYFLFKQKETIFKVQKSLFEKIFKSGWNWKTTGIIIGIIGMLAFIFSPFSGRNYPLGITMGFETIVKSVVTGQNFLNWESFEVIGLIIGAFFAALFANEFKIRTPPFKMGVQAFFGGILLGLGAIIAGGCNIGHILSGVPQLAIGSIVAGIFIVLGAWAAAYFMFMRGEK